MFVSQKGFYTGNSNLLQFGFNQVTLKSKFGLISESSIGPSMKAFQYQNIPMIAVQNENEGFEIAKYVKTFLGSMNYQKELDKFNQNTINRLLLALVPYFTELIFSKHANYFIQKLIKKLEFSQKVFVFQILQKDFIRICMHSSGTHTIQALIDSISTSFEEALLESYLSAYLKDLFFNKNSYHIIQKIILEFPEHKREYINNFIINNIDGLCINKFGFICVSKFISMTKDQMIKQALSQRLNKIDVFVRVISTQFGSSVLNYAITTFGIKYFEDLFKELKESKNLIFYASLNQNSSNFIYKYFCQIHEIDKAYYNNYLFSLLNPKKGFITTLLSIDFGKNLIYNLLRISNRKVKKFFQKKYHSSPKGKTIIQRLNIK